MGVLDGKVIAVTGGGRGIGRGYAKALAAEGARVVVNDFGSDTVGKASGRAEVADAVVAEIEAEGGQAVAAPFDVTDEAGAQAVVDTAVERWGRLDGLVNNAGILRVTNMPDVALDDFRSVLDVHVVGTFLTSRAAAKHWVGRAEAGETVDGRIVNTTSMAGLWGIAGGVAYSAAKAAILGITLTLGADLARHGVRVNCVAPGAGSRMNTERIEGMDPSYVPPPLELFPKPEWCAPVVVWLMSDRTAPVTGRVFENVGGVVSVLDGWRRREIVEHLPTTPLLEVFDSLDRAVAASPVPVGALMATDPTLEDPRPPSAIAPLLHDDDYGMRVAVNTATSHKLTTEEPA